MIAAFIFPRLSDVIGRKHTLLLVAVPYSTSWIIIAFADNIYLFYLARFIGGLGDACIFSTLPCYIGEVATPKVRGYYGHSLVCYGLSGQVYINVVGGYLDIQIAALVSLLATVLFVLTFIFAPESPYYYVMKNRKKDARISLQKLRGVEDVEEELLSIEEAIRRQMSESCSWKELFTVKNNRRAVLAGVFLRCTSQLAGVAVFMMYTQYIFKQSGGNLSAVDSSIIFTATMAVLSITASAVIEWLGRRLSLAISLGGVSVALACLAVYFYLLQETSEDLTDFKWVPLTGMLLYVVCFAFGTLTVPTLMLSELFSANIKAKGLSVLIVAFAAMVSITSQLFHSLNTAFGLYAPFAFFCVCSVVNVFVALKIVPETKGKTLEEIQQSLRK